MTNTFFELRRDRWSAHGFKNLLVWFFVYLVVGPFLEDLSYAKHILNALLIFVLISALVATSGSRRLLVGTTVLLVITMLLITLRSTHVYSPRMGLASVALACFLMPVVYSFAAHLFRVRKVTGNVICSALCLYLIIGLLWGAFYTVLESIIPGSFTGTLISGSDSIHETARHLEYFSYVTLSTLGYGDITPQTRGASALCQAEAIIGQFLTIALVARLVGIQVAQETTNNPS